MYHVKAVLVASILQMILGIPLIGLGIWAIFIKATLYYVGLPIIEGVLVRHYFVSWMQKGNKIDYNLCETEFSVEFDKVLKNFKFK